MTGLFVTSGIGVLTRLEFSTERARQRIDWARSQRLTPGTLVALTAVGDNFKTIAKVAVVANRTPDGLERPGGLPPTIDITWADDNDAIFDPNEELIMVESRSGYFESVRHTLVGIQKYASQRYEASDPSPMTFSSL